MRRQDWLAIVDALHLPVCCCPNFKLLARRFQVPEETLGSIYSQENQRRIIQSNSRLQGQIEHLSQRYLDGQPFLDICCIHNWPPCFLIRRLLEVSPWNLGRQRITRLLRDPDSILETEAPVHAAAEIWDAMRRRMLRDIRDALLCDTGNGPEADIARRETGLAYEARLAAGLEALGLAFWSEEALRAQGYFKTPDAKLQVPFLYKGRVISWIDSKATFGGEYIHQQQMAEQYQKYVNRYGAGLVVYWFGIIDELQEEDGSVVLAAALPEPSAIVTLPRLELPPLQLPAA